MNEGQPLLHDEQHAEDCHVRWMPRRNRKMEAPNYDPTWASEQCLFCRYFIPLTGALIEDWGACSNSLSVFDAIVRFEHDGCEQFTRADYIAQVDSDTPSLED
jgi:hypothetical protein